MLKTRGHRVRQMHVWYVAFLKNQKQEVRRLKTARVQLDLQKFPTRLLAPAEMDSRVWSAQDVIVVSLVMIIVPALQNKVEIQADVI